MNHIEAMKQALEALIDLTNEMIDQDFVNQGMDAITALRTAIEQAEKQEQIEAIEQEAKKKIRDIEDEVCRKVYTTPPAAPVQGPVKLWLWKNFVNGKPEYWAFDNPFPCVSVGGDPLTLGEPCGWALLKPSVNGRPDRSEQEVINTVTRLAIPPAAQRPVAEPHKWVGLTDEELSDIYNQTDWNVNENWDYERAIEAKLREKNGGQA